MNRNLNEQRKLQIENLAYAFGLSAPSLASVKGTDCLSTEDTGRIYSQRAVPTIPFYGPTNSRFISGMVSTENPYTGAARE